MDLFKDKQHKQNQNNNQQQNQSGNILGKKQPLQQNDYSKDISSLSRRARINEERALELRKKVQMLEHNMLTNHKKLLNEVKFINDELSELKRGFNDIKEKIVGFARELGEGAKKEDLQVLERYINMWEPVNFVTRKEVEKIVESKLREEQE